MPDDMFTRYQNSTKVILLGDQGRHDKSQAGATIANHAEEYRNRFWTVDGMFPSH